MKKIFFALLLLMFAGGCFANSVRYFTVSQAARAVECLNQQKEFVIFCGYEYELETYVVVSDVWMEPADDHFYEVWLFGYDAYTGEEIYMPLDLGCVWLYSYNHNHIYNAAHYLRFECDTPRPNIEWSMPVYNTYVKVAHPAVYHRTYHYDIHVFGWCPPPVPDPIHPIHPYYMRPPSAPLPVVVNPYTPGRDRPELRPSTATSRPLPTTQRTSSTPAPGSGRATSATGRPSSTSTPGASRSSSTTTPTPSTSRSSSTTTSTPSTSRSSSTTTGTPSTSRSSSTTTPSRRVNATETKSVPAAKKTSAPSSSRSVSNASSPSHSASTSSRTSTTPTRTPSSSR